MRSLKVFLASFLIGTACFLSFGIAFLAQQKITTLAPAREATAHQIHMEALTEESGCSATSVAKRVLLTASHCEQPTDKIDVDGKLGYTIERIIRDGSDHSLIFIKDIEFKEFAPLVLAPRELKAEDKVYLWGNPANIIGIQFNKQYRAGKFKTSNYMKARLVDIIEIPAAHGDSGAGLFNASGDLVAVLSLVGTMPVALKDYAITGAGAIRFNFKAEDIAQVTKY